MKDILTDPRDGKPGLSLETASSVIARDFIKKHMAQYHHVIRTDKLAGRAVAAAYIDALAGTLALVIAGGESKDDVLETVRHTLRASVERDLKHLRRG
jgi:hypothetical protein